MPIIIALFFNEIRSNIARSIFQVVTYLPKFMSTVVMTPLVLMLVKQGSDTSGIGILSKMLESLGFIDAATAQAGLLNNPAFFRGIYQISGIWETAGYDSTLLLNGARIFVFRVPVLWYLQNYTTLGGESAGIVMLVSNISVGVLAIITAIFVVRKIKRRFIENEREKP